LLQRFQSPLASLGINPSAIEHSPYGIDAVEDCGLWHDLRFYAKTAQSVGARMARAEFFVCDVVGQIMISPYVIFLLKYLGVMVEANARGFVVVNQPTLFAYALNEPDSGKV
jgi:hypothetical protein